MKKNKPLVLTSSQIVTEFKYCAMTIKGFSVHTVLFLFLQISLLSSEMSRSQSGSGHLKTLELRGYKIGMGMVGTCPRQIHSRARV